MWPVTGTTGNSMCDIEICSEQGVTRRRLPLSQGTEPRATLHATHAHSELAILFAPSQWLSLARSSPPPGPALATAAPNESVVLLYPTKSRRKEAGRTSIGATARQLQRPLAASETSAPLVRQLQRPVERRTSPLALATGPCSDSFSAAMRARSASICMRAEREGEGERACVGVPYVV